MRAFPLLLATLLFGCAGASANTKLVRNPDVQAFIGQMVSRHHFDRARLTDVFTHVQLRPDVIEAITRPAESKPWYQYRPIFLTEKRIREGVRFWDEHADALSRAEKEYGVPAQIITAIVGVETFYGRHAGHHRVIDALATLAFDYPPRADFFRGQLEEYLLMAREEGFDPLVLKGSYAGAMGQPQFIASSFRAYAVDFDGDGKRDLWDNATDVIGSVANYFHLHKWQPGEPVAARASVSGTPPQSFIDAGLKPSLSLGELRTAGVTIPQSLPADTEVALVPLQTAGGYEYWVTFDNFYVISRYNHSPLYSMAVYQLSEAIRTSRGR